ncbi:unnamed protein product [Auanema sp. JU1783]|nr:unnamed protein product [Auanema sp. JU1783]
MLFFLILVASAFAQENCSLQLCDLANTNGLTCPTGMECLNIENGFGRCCLSQTAVIPVIPRTIVTGKKSQNCVDLLNKSTGQSDCPSRAYLCQDKIYYDLMTIQCPKTCNRCNKSTSQSGVKIGCEDKKNPRTGRSDCPATAHLCNSPLYKNVMKEQCPKTCRLC